MSFSPFGNLKDLTSEEFSSQLSTADDGEDRFTYLTECDSQGRNLVHKLISANRLDLLKCAVSPLQEDQFAEVFKVHNERSRNTMHTLAVTYLSAEHLGDLLRLNGRQDTQELLTLRAEFGCTAIHWLAEKGDNEKMEVFVDFYKDDMSRWVSLLQLVDEENRTAVHFAAEMGRQETISLMLSHLSSQECASILNVQGNDDNGNPGWSALHMAVANENLDSLSSMLAPVTNACDRHQLLTLSDVYGETILHQAMGKKDKELLKRIMMFVAPEGMDELLGIQSNSGDRCIHRGASEQWLEGIQIILDRVPHESVNKLLQMVNTRKFTAEDVARDSDAVQLAPILKPELTQSLEVARNGSRERNATPIAEENNSRKQDADVVEKMVGNMGYLWNKVQQKGEENRRLQEEIERMKSPKAGEKTMEELESSDDALRRTFDGVIHERMKMRSEIDQLKKDKQELKKDKQELEEKNKKQKLKIKRLGNDVKDLREAQSSSNDERGREREGATKHIAELKTEVKMLREQIEALQLRGYSVVPDVQSNAAATGSSLNMSETQFRNPGSVEDPLVMKGDKAAECPVGEKEVVERETLTTMAGKSLSESSSDSDGTEEVSIPAELERLIDELCGKHKITDYMLLQNPGNLRKVVILGRNTDRITAGQLSELIKSADQFKRFSVTVSKRKDLLYSKQFMQVAHYLYDREIRCELLIQAQSIAGGENLYYILGCAHTMFSHQRNAELQDRDADHEGLRREFRQQVPPKNALFHFGNRREDQEAGDPEALLQYSNTPPLIGYRYYYHSDIPAAGARATGQQMQPEDEAEGLEPKHCMNDLFLLKFDQNRVNDYQQRLAQRRPPNVGPLVRIEDRNELKRYIQPRGTQYNIWVKDLLGVLCNHTALDGQRKCGLGYHLLFRLNDGQGALDHGDSGSIVYLERDGQYQPLGMFVARLEDDVYDDGEVYYQAVILCLAFKDIEHAYRDIVNNINPL